MYLTTARHPEDYEYLLKELGDAPNPSNQNFHTKFIDLLRERFEVQALSTRPLEKGIFVTERSHDHFFYPGYINNLIFRRASRITSSLAEIRRQKPDVIFVDTLNTTLLILAKRAKAQFNVKVIGIITDNPLNISDAKRNYAEDIFKYSAYCDGFVALTEGLVRLFNATNKPHVIIPGIINPDQKNQKTTDEYAFFAGALYERYGVGELIAAFKSGHAPYKLTIAGHGPLAETLIHNPHPNIEFLGHITPEVAFLLAQKASVNINPRPSDEQVDRYSVPSKVLDFINSGTVTISTPNEEIKRLVGETIYWINDNKVDTMLRALKDIKKDYEFYKIRALSARKELIAALDPKIILDMLGNLIAKL